MNPTPGAIEWLKEVQHLHDRRIIEDLIKYAEEHTPKHHSDTSDDEHLEIPE